MKRAGRSRGDGADFVREKARDDAWWAPVLAALDRFGRLTGVPDELPDLAEGAKRDVEALRFLASRGFDEPLIVGIVGPTGAGKSRLINTLAGEEVSRVSYRRPTTGVPVVWGDPAAARAVGRVLSGAVRPAGEAPRRREGGTIPPEGVVLIDSPDFDGHVREHRRRSSAVIAHSEFVLFVVLPVKYADEAVWAEIRALAEEGRPLEIVMNQLTRPGPRDDLVRRLRALGLDVPVHAVGYHPGPDEAPMPAVDPGVEEVRRSLARSSEPDERRKLRDRAFAAARRRLRSGDTARLLERVDRIADHLLTLSERIEALGESCEEDLEARLTHELDEDVAREVAEGILRQLERVDVFRGVRRTVRTIVGRPLRWIGLGARGDGGDAGSGPGRRTARERVEEDNAAVVAAVIAEFHSEADRLIRLSPYGPLIQRDPRWESMSRDSDRIRDEYHRFGRELDHWLRQEAARLVEGVATSQKAKFIGTQLVVNLALLGVELQTGGAFTLLDAAFHAIAGPEVAGVIADLLAKEEVRALRRRGVIRHRQGCRRLLATHAGAYRDLLTEAAERVRVPAEVRERLESVAGGSIVEAS